MRIVIFGDGLWAANSLLPLAHSGHEIAAVVLRHIPSDSSLEQAARNLNVRILQPANVNAPAFVEEIKSMTADLGISISCNQILRQPLLTSTRRGFINFHAGKLPNYRGRNVINWALINGESEIGLTAHKVDTGIDTGDIVLQRTLPINWNDTYGDLLQRIVEHFPALVNDAVSSIENGNLVTQPQRHHRGTYFCGRADGDEWLDWSDSSLNLFNKVRAISRPGPGARTLLGDKEVIVWKAAYDPWWPTYIATPGQVVGRCDDGVFVKTGNSTIVLKEVQVANGPCEKPTWPIGARLGVNLLSLVHSLRNRVQELENQISSDPKSYGATSSLH
ncbi:MAG: methionyl-tRNA formyltransferase [Pyrinomonadaceae bacterium]|nr:methionyl-tRNA formyltransferase [Pyrinomonadaceae bacterium]